AGRDVTDDPITAHDTAEHVAPNATEPEPDLVADGGDIVEAPTTGHDGRVFGRPEDQL
ncbi:hypothetical protein D320_22170, partial [Haloferax sp. BAB-2207]